MEGALIILAITVVTGFVLWLFDRRGRSKATPTQQDAEEPAEAGTAQECCGLHMVCEKDSLAPFTTEIEYYDDEELDRYKGRGADDYSAAEAEEFRDVLLTMRPEEIAGWSRSLQLRQIELPADVKEELLLIVKEAREKNTD